MPDNIHPPNMYNGLDGTEFLEFIVHRVRQNLQDDARFRRAAVYNNPRFTMKLDLSYEPSAKGEVLIQGAASPNDKMLAMAERMNLMEQDRVRQDQHVKRIEQEVGKLLQELAETKAALSAAVARANEPHYPVSTEAAVGPEPPLPEAPMEDVTASITFDSGVVEEPDRIREEMQLPSINPAPDPNQVIESDRDLIAIARNRPAAQKAGAVISGGSMPGGVKGRPKE
jgi:hypothetical protein